MKNLLLTLLLALSCLTARGQIDQIRAVTLPIGNPVDAISTEYVPMSGGEMVTVQSGNGGNLGIIDIVVTRFDASRNVLWQHTWGQPDRIYSATDVIVDNNGDIVIVGTTDENQFGIKMNEGFVLKVADNPTPTFISYQSLGAANMMVGIQNFAPTEIIQLASTGGFEYCIIGNGIEFAFPGNIIAYVVTLNSTSLAALKVNRLFAAGLNRTNVNSTIVEDASTQRLYVAGDYTTVGAPGQQGMFIARFGVGTGVPIFQTHLLLENTGYVMIPEDIAMEPVAINPSVLVVGDYLDPTPTQNLFFSSFNNNLNAVNYINRIDAAWSSSPIQRIQQSGSTAYVNLYNRRAYEFNSATGAFIHLRGPVLVNSQASATDALLEISGTRLFVYNTKPTWLTGNYISTDVVDMNLTNSCCFSDSTYDTTRLTMTQRVVLKFDSTTIIHWGDTFAGDSSSWSDTVLCGNICPDADIIGDSNVWCDTSTFSISNCGDTLNGDWVVVPMTNVTIHYESGSTIKLSISGAPPATYLLMYYKVLNGCSTLIDTLRLVKTTLNCDTGEIQGTDTVNCSDTGVSFTLVGQVEDADYQWSVSPGGPVISNNGNSTITVAFNNTSWTSITYTLTCRVIKNGCTCIYTHQVVSLPCPFECYVDEDLIAKGLEDHVYTENTTISTTTVLSGQYYIDDNVTLSFDGNIVVDITNCDLVFGQCAGISLSNGAKLRANNSVFRTCDPMKYWRGIIFDNANDDHRINDCVFKNAIIANDFVNSSATVHGNHYINNYIGLRFNSIDRVDMANTKGITDNEFVIDNPAPLTQDDFCDVEDQDAGNRFGILGLNTNFTTGMDGNLFVRRGNTPASLYGIYLTGAWAVMNGNSFNDNTVGVSVYNVLDYSNQISITNNKFNLVTFDTPAAQILINGQNSGTFIHYNKFTSLKKQVSESCAAIFLGSTGSAGSYFSINGNDIDNFQNGIIANNLNSSIIMDNTIRNSQYSGIYTSNTVNVDISCNYVDLDFGNEDNSQLPIGIYYGQDGTIGDNPDRIHSNCILDSKIGILLVQNNSLAMNIPQLRNNFIYNYLMYGIGISGFDRPGQSIGTTTLHGMNTFQTNFPNPGGTAADISSLSTRSNSIGIADNYYSTYYPAAGAFTLSGSTTFHSAASCGKQISSAATQQGLDFSLKCDPEVNEQLIPLMMVAPDITLREGFENLNEHEFQNSLAYISAALWAGKIDSVKARIYKDQILGFNISENRRHWINASFYIAENKFAMAMAELAMVEESVAEEREFVELCMLACRIHLEDYSLLRQDKYLLEYLTKITTQESANSDIAVALLGRLGVARPIYMVPDRALPEMPYGGTIGRITTPQLVVSPNPTKDQLHVRLLNCTETEGLLQVYSITGAMVKSEKVEINSGMIELNIEHLQNGIYTVRLSNSKQSLSSKFVKNN